MCVDGRETRARCGVAKLRMELCERGQALVWGENGWEGKVVSECGKVAAGQGVYVHCQASHLSSQTVYLPTYIPTYFYIYSSFNIPTEQE